MEGTELKYRKKPVVIEAVQYDGNNRKEVMKFVRQNGGEIYDKMGSFTELTIPTLEGDHTASVNDWIVKGVKSEFYPCKPDIFEMTYEPAEGDAEEVI